MAERSHNLSFFDHVDELRSRIIKSVLSFLILSIVAYQFADRFLAFLVRPIGRVIFTSPSEAFLAKLSITFLAGFFLSLPIVLFQIWRFVYSALTARERKFVLIYGPLSLLLFMGGSAFGYFVMVPVSLNFLMGFSSDVVLPMITVDKYISFIGSFVLAFGITFEMPIVLAFLAQIGIATPEFLRQHRRWAVIIILVVSAVLTPPDVFSQLLMALPLFVLYEASIVVCQAIMRGK